MFRSYSFIAKLENDAPDVMTVDEIFDLRIVSKHPWYPFKACDLVVANFVLVAGIYIPVFESLFVESNAHTMVILVLPHSDEV